MLLESAARLAMRPRVWVSGAAVTCLLAVQLCQANAAVPKVGGAHCYESPAGLGANLPLNRSNERQTDVVDIDGAITQDQSLPQAWFYETREHRLFVEYSSDMGKRSLFQALSAIGAPQAAWFDSTSGSRPLTFYEIPHERRIKSLLLAHNELAICFDTGPVKGL